jgi:hypothetical protein
MSRVFGNSISSLLVINVLSLANNFWKRRRACTNADIPRSSSSEGLTYFKCVPKMNSSYIIRSRVMT